MSLLVVVIILLFVSLLLILALLKLVISLTAKMASLYRPFGPSALVHVFLVVHCCMHVFSLLRLDVLSALPLILASLW